MSLEGEARINWPRSSSLLMAAELSRAMGSGQESGRKGAAGPTVP
jgi:hypothetical protein